VLKISIFFSNFSEIWSFSPKFCIFDRKYLERKILRQFFDSSKFRKKGNCPFPSTARMPLMTHLRATVQSNTCHLGSHVFACHPTQVNEPRLNYNPAINTHQMTLMSQASNIVTAESETVFPLPLIFSLSINFRLKFKTRH